MTAYQRGAKFERAVKADLEDHGYFCVRAAGSRSSLDVLAVRKGARALLVQAKLHGRIDPDERNQLISDALSADGLPVLAEKEEDGKIAYWVVAYDRGRGTRLAP